MLPPSLGCSGSRYWGPALSHTHSVDQLTRSSWQVCGSGIFITPHFLEREAGVWGLNGTRPVPTGASALLLGVNGYHKPLPRL